MSREVLAKQKPLAAASRRPEFKAWVKRYGQAKARQRKDR